MSAMLTSNLWRRALGGVIIGLTVVAIDRVMGQCDLFGDPLPPPEPEQVVELPLPPLAAPCGFRNRSNNPCQRLARDPVRLDGRELRSHGRLLLHCPMECFNGASAEETPTFAEAAE